MQAKEEHIGEAILADSNRRALGRGSLDLDSIIRVLYLVRHNADGRYVTPEPLGPGADPYPAMNGRLDAKVLEDLVQRTARYFGEREEAVLAEG
jgi:D-psicose/D-tagatose/L-ribulose 3-epimerase